MDHLDLKRRFGRWNRFVRMGGIITESADGKHEMLLVTGVLLSVRIIAGFSPINLTRALPLMLLEVLLLTTVSIAGGTRFSTVTNGILGLGFYGIAFIGGWIEFAGAMARLESLRIVGDAHVLETRAVTIPNAGVILRGMNFKTTLKLSLAFLSMPFLLSAQSTPATPVIRLQNLAHAFASIDKTVPFYRDVIGLPISGTRDPLAQQPQALDEDMSRFTATRGAKFRSAVFRVPNDAFGFELTEFTGIPRKSGQPGLQDIGAATLVLQIRDMDKMVAKLKAAKTVIVTAGGAPVNPSGNAGSKMRELLIRDPDGFFIELMRPDPLPAAAEITTDEIFGGSVNLSIEDSSKTVTFLRDAIGFNARPTGQLGTNAVVANLINLPGAQWRITHGSIPGTPLDFGLIEYSGVPRAKFSLGAEDPGSPAFTMVVGDIDAAVNQWKKAGGTVLSSGGAAIKRADGAGNVFVRDVNGFMWELIQRAGR